MGGQGPIPDWHSGRFLTLLLHQGILTVLRNNAGFSMNLKYLWGFLSWHKSFHYVHYGRVPRSHLTTKKTNGTRFWPRYLPAGEMCHPEEWHLDLFNSSWSLMPYPINSYFVGSFSSVMQVQPIFLKQRVKFKPYRTDYFSSCNMTWPALEKFQSTAFDLRNKMHFAPTVPLELCNWAINYILKIIIWIMGSKLGEVIRLSVLQVQHLVLVEFDSFTKWFFYSKQLSCFLCPWIIK